LQQRKYKFLMKFMASENTVSLLNDHYAAISTDHSYTSPHRKDPANLVESQYFSEWLIFQILDHQRP